MSYEKPLKRGVQVSQAGTSPESDDEGSGSRGADTPERQESAEERHARISEAAYRNAGKRGFAPGGELDDWLAAEREILEEPSG